jgi:uncharacterized protein YndB with AHSA1/START domain
MVDILHRVGIEAPIEKVYKTLTTIEGNSAWWDSGVTGSSERGGVMTFFKNVDMKVIETKPNEIVRWKCVRGPEEWMNTEISFELIYKQDQTFVLFKHAGWAKPVEFMHHCSTKWGMFLVTSLKPLVETGKGRPAPGEVQVYVGG